MAAYIKILKALDLFKPRNQLLRPGLSAEDANHEITKIAEIANEFVQIALKIAKDENSETDPAILKAINTGKYDILRHGIHPDLAEKYKTQLREFDNYDKLKKFLESIFRSTISKADQIANARRKLSEVVRFSQDNETFELFLSRIKSMGKPIERNSAKATADIFIEDAFYRNLSPQLKEFLADNGKKDSPIDDVAKFLDEREKFTPTACVNFIGDSELSTIKSQNNALRAETIELKHQIENLTNLVQTALLPIEANTEETHVNKIETRKKAEKHQDSTSRPKWHYQSNGRPVRCQQCGLFGHTQRNCPKTCRLTCHKCGKIGHLQAVCRQSKNYQ